MFSDRSYSPPHPKRFAQSRNCSPPPVPGTSGFVPVRLIANSLTHILALALHRTVQGYPRAGLSSHELAEALHEGTIVCDPLHMRWMPASVDTAVASHNAWGKKTGHEGDHHRHLRVAAACLFATWFPGTKIEVEQPRRGRGRHIRPDLQVRVGEREAVIAEIGAVDGNTIATLLLPRPNFHNPKEMTRITHVVVLPFSGQYATSARGYIFRLAEEMPFASPSSAELRQGWKNFVAQTFIRSRI